jgi:alkaline phosphatase D
MGRKSDPAIEVTTLDNYRRRHAQYKSDQDAQLMHATMPMIAVWDDHEVANDSYRDGAKNHDPNSEGSWEDRKAAAIQAYHEWMPIRTGPSKEIIYRSFDFGNLLSLHMLDTRLVGRDKVGEYTNIPDIFSPDRTMLGKDQFEWLDERLNNSPGKWQILGQQVLMSRMEIPISILQFLGSEGVTDLAGMLAAVTLYLTAKGTPEADRNPDQQDLLDPTKNPKFGYNLDAWDGYPIDREIILNNAFNVLSGLGNRALVVLAGDTHNAWHADITTGGYLAGVGGLAADTKVGTLLATSSVSSPGFEEYLAGVPPEQVALIFTGIIDGLKWMDASRRGFIMLTVTPDEIQSDWVFVTSVFDKEFTSEIVYSATIPFEPLATSLFN